MEEQVYVFIDDSSLWIEGQKYRAREQELQDTEQDPRYRVDLGKFLDLVVANVRLLRRICMALSHHQMIQFGKLQERETMSSRCLIEQEEYYEGERRRLTWQWE